MLTKTRKDGSWLDGAFGELGVFRAVAIGLLASACSAASPDEEEAAAEEVGSTSDEIRLGPVARGAIDFARPIPTGNGRACATCHVPTEAFGLTPQHVERRYQAFLRGKDDPLFRSIDANDGRRDFTNLRKGLVKVTMPLPPNVVVVGEPATRSVDVWRAVPSIENVAMTAPYQFDGRATTLEEQASGAAFAHSQVRSIERGFDLGDVAAFEKSIFSSPRARAIAAGQTPPEPRLTALQARGKQAFVEKCTQCHGGPAFATPMPEFGTNFQSVIVAELNFAGLPTKTFRITDEMGVTETTTADLGRALVTGSSFDAGRFDTPPLLGISRTAPYFHDNSAPTLEAVMQFYQLAFGIMRDAGAPEFIAPVITDDDVTSIAAYMRTL